MVRFLLGCRRLFEKYSKDEMSVYAAQASFFIILASIPFLMLLLSLIQATPLVNESDLLSLVVQMVPDTLDGLVVYVLDSLHSDSPMALLSATAIAALWSSSRGMLSIERGLNRVWGTEIQRNYIVRRIICAGYTVLFSLMCLLCMVLLVFGEQIQKQVWAWIPLMSTFDFLAFPVRGLVTLAILFIFFLAIYAVLPFRRLSVKSQTPGAAFAAVGWALFSTAFSIYFRYFKNFTVTYGSLAAVILMMLWLYFCICILFMGAEINWWWEFHAPSRNWSLAHCPHK